MGGNRTVLAMTIDSATQSSPRPANVPTGIPVWRLAWPEFLMEAGCLGLFMLSACCFAVLLEYPNPLLHSTIPNASARRALMGLAMGCTLLLIVHTSWGKQSGAHMNPAVTLSYLWLGKLSWIQAAFYILGQFLGGILGVILAWRIVGPALMHQKVNFVVTTPGEPGIWIAFLAEVLMSFVMMTTILWASNSRRFSRWTPYFAALLVALFITLEAPLSGMSMNPARSFGSAFAARQFSALWIYFTAPLAGMLLAAACYRRRVYCAKLHHHNNKPCPFWCNYGDLYAESK